MIYRCIVVVALMASLFFSSDACNSQESPAVAAEKAQASGPVKKAIKGKEAVNDPITLPKEFIVRVSADEEQMARMLLTKNLNKSWTKSDFKKLKDLIAVSHPGSISVTDVFTKVAIRFDSAKEGVGNVMTASVSNPQRKRINIATFKIENQDNQFLIAKIGGPDELQLEPSSLKAAPVEPPPGK